MTKGLDVTRHGLWWLDEMGPGEGGYVRSRDVAPFIYKNDLYLGTTIVKIHGNTGNDDEFEYRGDILYIYRTKKNKLVALIPNYMTFRVWKDSKDNPVDLNGSIKVDKVKYLD